MKRQLSNVEFQISKTMRFVFTMFVAAFFCGCIKKSEPANTASAENVPLRIVSMAPNLTEILFALGLDEEIVGVTRHCNFPQKAESKTCIGTFWLPDIEAVLACRPTLVITEGFPRQAALAARLKNMGCRTLTLDIETIEQLHTAILAIGDAVDRTEAARGIVEQLKKQQAEMTARYADVSPRLKVLWVIQREPLRVAGRKTFPNELIESVGGVNAVGDTPHQYPPVSAETVLGTLPDVIIETADDREASKKQKETASQFYRRFASVPAVQRGRIYVLEGDLVCRLGPRLNEGMEQVAECLWPKEKP
ncbi:MAG: helical backbone metal receptor [Planctomycetales bacterium]|nr:helical backbone metal receptor [Planctomycetales bacterium]